MGTVNSHLNNKKKKCIQELEILNKSLENLKILEREELRQQQLLISQKQNYLEEIHEEKNNLLLIKQKKSNLIETIKLFECKICMERPNKIMCIPCGHCYCLECSRNLEHCPLCRSKIESINNIYFN